MRRFSGEQIPQETMRQILRAGVMAPSAMNKQPWRFCVIQDQSKIQEYDQKAVQGCIDDGIEERLGVSLEGQSIFFNAPTLVLVSADRNWEWKRDDCNLAIQNMFLAAYSLGVGSCWIGFGLGLDKDSSVRSELGIPDEEEIIAALIFGFPQKKSIAVPDRDVIIHAWIGSS